MKLLLTLLLALAPFPALALTEETMYGIYYALYTFGWALFVAAFPALYMSMICGITKRRKDSLIWLLLAAMLMATPFTFYLTPLLLLLTLPVAIGCAIWLWGHRLPKD